MTSRLQSFETDLLSQDENLTGLARVNRELIDKAETKLRGSAEQKNE